MGTVKLHQTCKYAQTLLMSGGGKEKNIPCDWKSIPEMTLKEVSFWQDNPRLADCLADRLKVIDGIKQPRAEKWAPLSSLASWCLKLIRNGSATQSFQVKSVLKWLCWSYAACLEVSNKSTCLGRLATHAEICSLCVIVCLVVGIHPSLGSSHWTHVFRVDEYLIWSPVRGFCLISRIWDRVRKPD